MKNPLRLISEGEKKSILEMHDSFKGKLQEQTFTSMMGLGMPEKIKKTIEILKKLGYGKKDNTYYFKTNFDQTQGMNAFIYPDKVEIFVADEAESHWNDPNVPRDDEYMPLGNKLFIKHGDPNMEQKIKDFEKKKKFIPKSSTPPKPNTPKPKPTNNLPKPQSDKSEPRPVMSDDGYVAESRIEKMIRKVLREELLKEDEPEPTIDFGKEESSGFFTYDEGKSIPKKLNGRPFNTELRDRVVTAMSETLKRSIPTIQKFHKSDKFNLPKFIKINVGTSSSGTPEANVKVAESRANYLRNMVLEAFAKLNVRPDVVLKVVTINTDASYRPSSLDVSFFDERIVPPRGDERFGQIVFEDLITQGQSMEDLSRTVGIMNNARAKTYWEEFYYDDVDEETIERALSGPFGPKTYSDIQDLDTILRAQNDSLEGWLNRKFDDEEHDQRILSRITGVLDKAARQSGCQTGTVRHVNNTIDINTTLLCNQKY